jgi:hypothetical protein
MMRTMRALWLVLVLGCGGAHVPAAEIAEPSPSAPSAFAAAAGTPWASFTPYDPSLAERAPDMAGDFVAITTEAMPSFDLEGVVVPLTAPAEQRWLADVWDAMGDEPDTGDVPISACRERPPALRDGSLATIVGPGGPIAARVTGCRIAQDAHNPFAFVSVSPSPGPFALVRFGPASGQLVAPAPVPATEAVARRVRAQLVAHADLSSIADQIEAAQVDRIAARMPAPAAALLRITDPAGCSTIDDCELLALVATREDGELLAIFHLWSVMEETHARTLLSLEAQGEAARVLYLVRGRGAYDELLVHVTDLGLDAIVRVTFEPEFAAQWLFSHPSG